MPDDVVQDPEAFRQKMRAEAANRPIAYEEFYYLLGRYPYLEISHPQATHYPTSPPTLVQGSSHWNIHYWDQLMISSQSALLTLLLTGVDLSDTGLETVIQKEQKEQRKRLRAEAAGQQVAQDPEKRFAGDSVSPVGTIVNQFFNTGLEMVGLARQGNWPGIRIIRGYYPMQRAAWIACENQGLTCEGFDPTPEDHVVYSWVKSLADTAFEKITTRPSRK